MKVLKSTEAAQIQNQERKSDRGKKVQVGRERPHFFGFQPPKKFVGSLPPSSEDPDEPNVLHRRPEESSAT